MNILVLCHHYKNHEILTLINGKTVNDYIYLTPENIHNISSLTNGAIEKISFLDTDPSLYSESDTNLGIIQYKNADELPDGSFDAIYTIHCSPFMNLIQEYGSKLKSSGKIIDVKADYYKTPPNDYPYDDNFFPFFVKPLSLSHEKSFGETVHKLVIKDPKLIRYIRVNRDLLPTIDDYGVITPPSQKKGGYKKNKKVPIRYVPKSLSKKDKKKQINMLKKSQKMYKNKKYYTRKPLASYKNKTSNHIINAQKIYGISKISPNKELAKATGCSISALKKIVKKGQGAYFSSGSRPNQTGQSWGLARLASSITAGKAAAVDYDILDKGCDHKKKAFMLANKSRKKYKFGHSKTKKTII
jgi:hypothetical protein